MVLAVVASVAATAKGMAATREGKEARVNEGASAVVMAEEVTVMEAPAAQETWSRQQRQ